MPNRIGYLALRAGLSLKSGRQHRRMLADAKSPDAASEALLRRILAENAGTAFGQAHGFAHITTADQYRQAVPIQTYESLRDLIERQERTGEPCLTKEQPVFYNRTSGTVAAPKDIPITKPALSRIKGLQRLTAYVMATKTSMLTGKVFSITGAAIEGAMPGGTPSVQVRTSPIPPRVQLRLRRTRRLCWGDCLNAMRLERLEAYTFPMPFKTVIRHASASRQQVENLIVVAHSQDSQTGFGEGCPREYVTGETMAGGS